MNQHTTAASLYEKYTTDREPYLQRARDAAALTLPSLIPPDNASGTTKYPTPYQGVGARGVNNLASKLVLALLPAHTPFFRMAIDDYTLEELTDQEGMRAEVEEALNSYERAVQAEIESDSARPTIFEAVKQLIVAGNALLYLRPQGGIRLFRLDNFVVRRDPTGKVLEGITKEHVAPATMDEETRSLLDQQEQGNDEEIPVYTRFFRNEDQWTSYMEIKGEIVPGSVGSYPLDKCPWLPLRFTKVDGDDYGRSYVEEYMGDLKSLEGLTQAIVEGSAAAAKLLFFVNPNGVTRARQVKEAPNLAILSGNAQDISVFRVEKMADFSIAAQTAATMEDRLSKAFMLQSSIQRAGERVTAEEIRFMAGEIEDALGGVYSILSQELQLPLVRAYIHRMEMQKRLPTLPKEAATPTITAGMEALGRGHDLSNLLSFQQALVPLAQAFPEEFKDYLVVGDIIKRIGVGHGLDMKGMVRSEQEVAEMRQEREKEQMMMSMAPAMMPGAPT